MLTLNREKGESVYLTGPDGLVIARIVVASIERHEIKLSIDAPDAVGIERDDYVLMNARPGEVLQLRKRREHGSSTTRRGQEDRD